MKRNEVVKAQAQERAEEAWHRGADAEDSGASLREIADALISAGVRTARGGGWHPQAVARVVERLQR